MLLLPSDVPKPANTAPRNHPHSNDCARLTDGRAFLGTAVMIRDGNHGCGWGGVTFALL